MKDGHLRHISCWGVTCVDGGGIHLSEPWALAQQLLGISDGFYGFLCFLTRLASSSSDLPCKECSRVTTPHASRMYASAS